MADANNTLDMLAERLTALTSAELQARLDRLDAEAQTLRAVLGTVRRREQQERRRQERAAGTGVRSA